MLEVAVQYALPRRGLPAARILHRAARAAWRGTGTAAVTLRVVDAVEGLELNRTFRGRDVATNVLSFPTAEWPAMPSDETHYLGDVVLCAPVLAQEADAYGKTPGAHYSHMVIHGLLHLQGMDHQEPAEAAAMEAVERSLLAGLGYPDPYHQAGISVHVPAAGMAPDA